MLRLYAGVVDIVDEFGNPTGEIAERKMLEQAIIYANIIKKENVGCTEIDKLVCEVLKEE